jgi:hypothetical protein
MRANKPVWKMTEHLPTSPTSRTFAETRALSRA